LSAPRVLTLLAELAACGVQSVTFTGGGEPLVHQQATEVFAHCHALGMQYGVVTNGRRLEGPVAREVAAHAVFVRVSLDAGTAQTHQLLHATALPEYEKILDNLKAVRAQSETLTIGASMCVFDCNVDEIQRAARQVKAHGGNYLEVRPVFPTEWRGGGFARALSDENVARAKEAILAAREESDGDGFRIIGMVQRFDQLSDHGKGYDKCRIGPLTTVINADGHIYHCCQQRGMPEFRAGSVLEQPFAEVWWNAQHREMVDRIDVKECPPCRYDGYNRIISEALIGDAMHRNFL
jgi:radical SAM protein with 4Fe4S-binding SPASM domain